ncbi:MAG: IPT/TIG domain-containing protein [Planctomycetes bacterium]|nr:IPT/TIG domain-containing protein [Planctomycetota bacterium]
MDSTASNPGAARPRGRPLSFFLIVPALLAAAAWPAAAGEVTQVAPAEGTTGTLITIDGTGFGAAEPQVLLLSEHVTKQAKLVLVSWDDARIVAQVKKGFEGLYDVIVRPDGGAEILVPAAFAIRAPAVSGIEPPAAAAGEPVAISGTFFGATPGKVSLGCAGAVIQEWLPERIVFTFSAGVGSGPHNVTVRSKSGQATVCGGLLVAGASAPCQEAPELISAVAAALEAVLADAADPAAEFTALAQEVAAAYEGATDPARTHDDLLATALSTLDSAADIQADALAAANAPDFIEFPLAGGSEAQVDFLVILVNGLDTPPEHACFALGNVMRRVIAATPETAGAYKFELFYDRSTVPGQAPEERVARGHLPLGVFLDRPLASDLLRLGADCVSPHAAAPWRAFLDAYSLGAGPYAPPATAHEIVETISGDLLSAPVSAAQVDLLAQEIEGATAQGWKVVLLPCAHGNYLAEQALLQLDLEAPAVLSQVGLVALGSPTAYTDVKQKVCRLRRKGLERDAVLAVPGAPAGNMRNEFAKSKLVNRGVVHSLERSYLACEESAAKVSAAVRKVASALAVPPVAGDWEGSYELDYHDFFGCGGFTDKGDMQMTVDGSGKEVSGDASLEDMSAVMPQLCTKLGEITREMDMSGEVKAGNAPGEATITGELTYTCPLTGVEYTFEFAADVQGDTMEGTLDGGDGEVDGTFSLTKKD